MRQNNGFNIPFQTLQQVQLKLKSTTSIAVKTRELRAACMQLHKMQTSALRRQKG